MKSVCQRRALCWSFGFKLLVAATLLIATRAEADVIEVAPTDDDLVNAGKIEGAGPGDEVLIQPGTYRFRLYLEAIGSAQNPIVIRAKDPTQRPIWDLDGQPTADWPGTYTAGDRGRSIWQITGSYYQISDIIFRNGSDESSGDGGGVRMKGSDHLTMRNCLFQYNDNGLQGAGTNTMVEHCEFDSNGLASSSEGSHNLYIHGGDLVVRYCYIHDPRRAQNMHIRANNAVFEYNWIARSKSYMGDMMPCTMEPCESEQRMLLRGNVFVRGTPTNDGQVFVMHNDQHATGKQFYFEMVNNTVIGNGDNAAMVHFSNENPTEYPNQNAQQTAVLRNNVFYDVARIFYVDESGLANWSASGNANWLSTGTTATDGLTGSVTGTNPGFVDLAALNLVPAAGSAVTNKAAAGENLPAKEYYKDETTTMAWRERLTVADIGAFESTTSGPAFDIDGQLPGTGGDDGGVSESDAAVDDAATLDGGVHDADRVAPDPNARPDDGCSCRHRGTTNGTHLLMMFCLLSLFLTRKFRFRG